MDIKEARELLGEEYADIPDEVIEEIITLATLICDYVIATHGTSEKQTA